MHDHPQLFLRPLLVQHLHRGVALDLGRHRALAQPRRMGDQVEPRLRPLAQLGLGERRQLPGQLLDAPLPRQPLEPLGLRRHQPPPLPRPELREPRPEVFHHRRQPIRLPRLRQPPQPLPIVLYRPRLQSRDPYQLVLPQLPPVEGGEVRRPPHHGPSAGSRLRLLRQAQTLPPVQLPVIFPAPPEVLAPEGPVGLAIRARKACHGVQLEGQIRHLGGHEVELHRRRSPARGPAGQ